MSISLVNLADLKGMREAAPHRWTLFGPPAVLAEMPLEHRDQILFLDAPSTQALYDACNRRRLLCGDDGWGNTPFIGGCFQKVERYSVGEEADLKKWLYRRGVPFATSTFLLPAFGALDDPAVLTSWKIVVKYAAALFGQDNLVVVNEKADWCLHYHHDGALTFAHELDMTKIRW